MKQKKGLPSLGDELNEAAEQVDKKEKEVFAHQNLSQYAIKGSDEDWTSALNGGKQAGMVSLKTGEKRPVADQEDGAIANKHKKKKKKGDKENLKKRKV